MAGGDKPLKRRGGGNDILHISASVPNAPPAENCSMASNYLISEEYGLDIYKTISF